MISELWEKLRDPEYRTAFVAAQINIGIPFQIRALLKSRPGWKQETLAERTGMLQPRISGLMTPGKTRPNIETLRRVAEAFDCGLMVRFVPFSELARRSEEFDPERFHVPEFENDSGFVERKPVNPAISSTADDPLWEELPVALAGGMERTNELTETVKRQGPSGQPQTAALNVIMFPGPQGATEYRAMGGSTNAR